MSKQSMCSNDLQHVSEQGSVAWQQLPWAKHSLVLSGDITMTSAITSTSAPPVQPACLSLLQRHAVGTPSTPARVHSRLLLIQTSIHISIPRLQDVICSFITLRFSDIIKWLLPNISWVHGATVTPDRLIKTAYLVTDLLFFIILIMDESNKPACPTEVDGMKGYLTTAAALRIWSYSKSNTSDSPFIEIA